MTDDLSDIIHLMNTTYGLDISPYSNSFLTNTLKNRMETTLIQSVREYGEYLGMHHGETEAFYRSLQVSYSEFFRNPLTFAILEQLVLPRVIEQKKSSVHSEIRIWSAGCAAGQESYSIAILLDELSTVATRPVPYRIFATDRSEAELTLAKMGVYDARAIQNVRMKHIHQYFTSNHDTWSIAQKLKDRIEFSLYDFLDTRSFSPPGCIFGDFDLITCCNLLLYYQPEIQQIILKKISRALTDGGYLACGETERAIIDRSNLFVEVGCQSAVYRKRTNREEQ